jgi:hypothetical protein
MARYAVRGYEMTIRDRVREWLGIKDIEARIELTFDITRTDVRARHSELLETMIQLINALSTLNKRMINEHVAPRQYSEPTLDWDTVQAMALAELERNPQKEN